MKKDNFKKSLTQPVKQRFWRPGVMIASATAMWITAGEATLAATFRVEYTGSVESLTETIIPRFSPEDTTIESVETLNTYTTRRTVSVGDTIVGSYTFDNENTPNRRLVSSRFRFVSADSDVSRSPSATASSDIVMRRIEPGETFVGDPDDPEEFRFMSSSADSSSANYFQSVSRCCEEFSSNFSVDNLLFSYLERGSELGASANGSTLVNGNISSFIVINEQDPGDETPSIPESNSIISLLLLSGLGFLSSKHKPHTIRKSQD